MVTRQAPPLRVLRVRRLRFLCVDKRRSRVEAFHSCRQRCVEGRVEVIALTDNPAVDKDEWRGTLSLTMPGHLVTEIVEEKGWAFLAVTIAASNAEPSSKWEKFLSNPVATSVWRA